MLKTYTLAATADYIFYLLDQERDDLLWDMWLHTSMEKSFIDFKKEQKVVPFRKKQNKKVLTEEVEKKLLDFATQFVAIKEPTT